MSDIKFCYYCKKDFNLDNDRIFAIEILHGYSRPVCKEHFEEYNK